MDAEHCSTRQSISYVRTAPCEPKYEDQSGAVAQATSTATRPTQDFVGKLAELDRNSREFRSKVDEIVKNYLPLADGIARRFDNRGESREDLVQVARLGLLNAVYRFDPEIGTEFISFAVPTIRGEIRRHLRDNSWSVKVPRRLKELSARLDATTSNLCQRLGRAPTASELAEELGEDRGEIVAALVARGCYKTYPITGGNTYGGEIGTDSLHYLGYSDSGLERIEDWETLRPLLERLPEVERTVLHLRFVESRTQTEIAKCLGVSQMQVSRLLRRSLSDLRNQLQYRNQPTDDS